MKRLTILFFISYCLISTNLIGMESPTADSSSKVVCYGKESTVVCYKKGSSNPNDKIPQESKKNSSLQTSKQNSNTKNNVKPQDTLKSFSEVAEENSPTSVQDKQEKAPIKKIIDPVVQYRTGFMGNLYNFVMDSKSVRAVIATLEQDKKMNPEEVVDMQHKVEWAINELIRRIITEENKNGPETIQGLQTTITINQAPIDSLSKILELSQAKEVQITETILTNAYGILVKHESNAVKFAYLISQFMNSQIKKCKDSRCLIEQLKKATNKWDSDIGYISDNEYDDDFEDLFKKIKLENEESKKNSAK